MKSLREARLENFYPTAVLEAAGDAVWRSIDEMCVKYAINPSDFRYSNYFGGYTKGFARCLAILQTVAPAKSFFPPTYDEKMWRIILSRRLDRWAYEEVMVETDEEFVENRVSLRRAYSDGLQDGVSYFSSLPFHGKIAHFGSYFGDPFLCLENSLRNWTEVSLDGSKN